MTFEAGNIATVIDEDSCFYGKQCEVVGVPIGDESSLVMFGADSQYLFDYDNKERMAIVGTLYLRKDADWSSENRARQLFGDNMFHSLHTFRGPLLKCGMCMCEGCENVATERVMVNNWGTVVEYDTCQFCKEKWHGKCADAFPLKDAFVEQ